jgi:hypothetical protein
MTTPTLESTPEQAEQKKQTDPPGAKPAPADTAKPAATDAAKPTVADGANPAAADSAKPDTAESEKQEQRTKRLSRRPMTKGEAGRDATTPDPDDRRWRGPDCGGDSNLEYLFCGATYPEKHCCGERPN